jgi:hypothetical protein
MITITTLSPAKSALSPYADSAQSRNAEKGHSLSFRTQRDAVFPILQVAAKLHVRRQILSALPELLILQSEEDSPDLAGGATAPEEFAQRHRDERSGHPHAVLLRVASTRPPRSRA